MDPHQREAAETLHIHASLFYALAIFNLGSVNLHCTGTFTRAYYPHAKKKLAKVRVRALVCLLLVYDKKSSADLSSEPNNYSSTTCARDQPTKRFNYPSAS